MKIDEEDKKDDGINISYIKLLEHIVNTHPRKDG